MVRHRTDQFDTVPDRMPRTRSRRRREPPPADAPPQGAAWPGRKRARLGAVGLPVVDSVEIRGWITRPARRRSRQDLRRRPNKPPGPTTTRALGVWPAAWLPEGSHTRVWPGK